MLCSTRWSSSAVYRRLNGKAKGLSGHMSAASKLCDGFLNPSRPCVLNFHSSGDSPWGLASTWDWQQPVAARAEWRTCECRAGKCSFYSQRYCVRVIKLDTLVSAFTDVFISFVDMFPGM